MKSKEYAGRRLLTAFLRAPFDFKRKSKMVPLLLKFLRKAHKFLLNLDPVFDTCRRKKAEKMLLLQLFSAFLFC